MKRTRAVITFLSVIGTCATYSGLSCFAKFATRCAPSERADAVQAIALSACLLVLMVAIALDRRLYRPGKPNYVYVMILGRSFLKTLQTN